MPHWAINFNVRIDFKAKNYYSYKEEKCRFGQKNSSEKRIWNFQETDIYNKWSIRSIMG